MKNNKNLKISSILVEELKNRFFTYVQNFENGDDTLTENTILKKKHTIRVCKEILTIGNSLKLSQDKLHFAEITALFHDIGRFEQYAKYRTFADGKSVNHALLGVEILQKNKILDILDDSTKSLVYRIISYHNRALLPEKETKTCLFFTKLLRDADKLDIWRVVTGYYRQDSQTRNGALELDLPDTPGFSDKVYEGLMRQKIVDFRHVKNLNDFKLLQVGWVFDINFDATFAAIQKRRYLNIIQEALPDSEKIHRLFGFIQSYLNQKNSPSGTTTSESDFMY